MPRYKFQLFSRPGFFPGYGIYLWIDADVWIQNWEGVDRYIAGAGQHGLAASVHDHPAYYNSLNLVTYRFRKFEQAYGVEFARKHVHSPYYNAGILAIASDAPHWAAWARWLQKVIESGNPDTLNKISDQIPLNAAIHEEALSVDTLSAIYNWQCHLCLPCWNECSGKLCEPVNQYEISMIHLTGKYKTDQEYRIKTTDGKIKSFRLRYNNHQG